MPLSPLAGKPAPADLLIDVERLVGAYYTRKPDPGDPQQLVSFGTSGHRGTAENATFTEAHILAITQAICDYRTSKGITNPWRLTLTDGTVTHDASFQPIEEHQAVKQLASGTEMGFVDSYKYNIAAYQLAEMLGMDDMLPVYVERSWKGDRGSLSWWLPVKMDEEERRRKNLKAPDLDAWNNQMYRVRVFDQLVDDTDANLTNVLIGED